MLRDFAETFDLELFVSALCCVAEAMLEPFTSKLESLFPNARVIGHVSEMRKDEEVCLMIADVKDPDRIREKIKEAMKEHNNTMELWPYIQTIGDLLRASIVLRSFDTYADAWQKVERGFDLRDGRGRLKVWE